MKWIQYPSQQPGGLATLPAKISIPAPSRGNQMDESHHNRIKRPHTKSRRGCFNCKARKVKCQETKPACANCTTRDLDCIYPSKTMRKPSDIPERDVSSLTSATRLSGTPFTGDDLRFFHHFLLVARPYLPFGSEEAWRTRVPAYAHECPHLMHAILSLGATHYGLTTQTSSQVSPMAIAHRGKALQLLSTALAKANQSTNSDLDGILATCYTLVFQSYYMNDGLMDFAVMVRGCGMVTNHIHARFKNSTMFLLQTREQVNAMVTPSLPIEPHPRHDIISTCIEDIDRLYQFVQSNGEENFFQTLRSTYLGMQRSTRDAFVGMTMVYATWYDMQNQEFMKFIASANHVTRALFIHYFTIDTFMRPFLLNLHKQERPSMPFAAVVVNQWTRTIYDRLPSNMRCLLEHEIIIIEQEKERTCDNSSVSHALG